MRSPGSCLPKINIPLVRVLHKGVDVAASIRSWDTCAALATRTTSTAATTILYNSSANRYYTISCNSFATRTRTQNSDSGIPCAKGVNSYDSYRDNRHYSTSSVVHEKIDDCDTVDTTILQQSSVHNKEQQDLTGTSLVSSLSEAGTRQGGAPTTSTVDEPPPSSLQTPRSTVLVKPSVENLFNPSRVGLERVVDDRGNDNHNDDDRAELFGLRGDELYGATNSTWLPPPQLIYDNRIHLPSAPQSWEGYEPSTPLTEEIIALIGVTGRPISVSDYMRMALTHPTYGYYTQATGSINSSIDNDFDNDEYLSTSGEEDRNDQSIIGPTGDFITAPEISQIFGECIGIWFYSIWEQQHQRRFENHERIQREVDASTTVSNDMANGWQWLECGPGRGSLMADLITFTMAFNNEFTHTCRAIHFIETSPALRLVQRNKLIQECTPNKVSFRFHNYNAQQDKHDYSMPFETSLHPSAALSDPTLDVYWHESLTAFRRWQDSPSHVKLPIFCICQEFVDALPIYSFEKSSDGWRERLVDVAIRDDLFPDQLARDNAASVFGALKPRLRIVLAPEVTPPLRTLLASNEFGQLRDQQTDATASVGSIVEVCPEGMMLVQDLSSIIARQGGAALVIDYGHEGSSDSIRGFARHKQVHFLSRSGHVDITADVDFAALRHAVNNPSSSNVHHASTPVRAFGPVTQGNFLMSMGIQERVIEFIERDDVSDEQAQTVYNAMVRLTATEEMGEKYKVLAITQMHDRGTSPPGF